MSVLIKVQEQKKFNRLELNCSRRKNLVNHSGGLLGFNWCTQLTYGRYVYFIAMPHGHVIK